MAIQKFNPVKSNAVQDVQVVSTSENTSQHASGDTRAVARMGMWVLGLGFGGFLLWDGFAPLDEGVPTQGVVTLDTKRKTVVLISHRPGIVSVADRLLILHEGTVQASGPRDGVLAALQKQREQALAAANAAQVAPPGAAPAAN